MHHLPPIHLIKMLSKISLPRILDYHKFYFIFVLKLCLAQLKFNELLEKFFNKYMISVVQ